MKSCSVLGCLLIFSLTRLSEQAIFPVKPTYPGPIPNTFPSFTLTVDDKDNTTCGSFVSDYIRFFDSPPTTCVDQLSVNVNFDLVTNESFVEFKKGFVSLPEVNFGNSVEECVTLAKNQAWSFVCNYPRYIANGKQFCDAAPCLADYMNAGSLAGSNQCGYVGQALCVDTYTAMDQMMAGYKTWVDSFAKPVAVNLGLDPVIFDNYNLSVVDYKCDPAQCRSALTTSSSTTSSSTTSSSTTSSSTTSSSTTSSSTTSSSTTPTQTTTTLAGVRDGIPSGACSSLTKVAFLASLLVTLS